MTAWSSVACPYENNATRAWVIVAFVIVATLLKSQEFSEFRDAAVKRFLKKGGFIPGAEEAQDVSR